MKSLLFPQFKENPLTGWQIKLPKLVWVQINLHRPIPKGFVIKQVRVLKKAKGCGWVGDADDNGSKMIALVGLSVNLAGGSELLACPINSRAAKSSFLINELQVS